MKNKVPKLRFPEFSGEWEEKKLGEISDVRDGTHDSPKYIEKGYPFITSKNLMENGQINFKDINYISKEDYISINKRSQVTKGDILFGMIGTIGNPVIVTKEGFAIKNVALIKEQNNLKNNFLLQLLKSSITKKQFHVLNAGGTQKFISLGLIRDLEFNIPSLPEQEKIANFLSSVDIKIEKLEKKKELLEKYKKGMIQKLFSQKLRFKDENGNDYSEWKEKKLGEIGKVSMCKRIMKDQTTISGEIPFYKIGTFGKQADAFITYELFNEYKSKYSYPAIGDILLSASGTIGRTVIYDGKPAYFQDSNIVWISNNEKLLKNNFLYYLYSNMNWTTEDTTIARLYNNNLISMKINIPSLPEQEKIANLLSSIDRKIELAEEELEKNKEFKKGLLQQMFV